MFYACVVRLNVTKNLKNFVFFFKTKQRLGPAMYSYSTIEALFSSKFFWEIDTVALSFVFDKYCPIID